MLPDQRQRAIAPIIGALVPALSAQSFFDSIHGAGTWNAIVPVGGTYLQQLEASIRAAVEQRWLRDLIVRLMNDFPARLEFGVLLAEIDRVSPAPTAPSIFEEVLLDSGRPFVNRGDLRDRLQQLIGVGGPPALLIDGEPKTGKSYSYYLISHVAPVNGFRVHKFSVASFPDPGKLAGEVLRRILGDDVPVPPIGNESAELWAPKLATKVYRALENGPQRVFVFDDFPTTVLPDGTVLEQPLPDGTSTFLIRLATYADEELKGTLKVVFVHFRAALPQSLDDVALREKATLFTDAHMVKAVMQVARARKWSVTDKAVKKRVEKFHETPGRTLNDGFKFIRELLWELEKKAS
jgi:hypothetical protein